jgi:hypothetical protein
MRQAFLALAGSIIIVSFSVHATTFEVRQGDAVIENAEVCYFAAGAAASPISRFLQHTNVTCVTAGGDIPLPESPVNVFARRGSELISDSVLLVTAEERDRKILALSPARRLAIPVGPGERPAVYVVRTASLIPGDVAPAGETVVPLVLNKNRIVRAELGGEWTKDDAAVVVPVSFNQERITRKNVPRIYVENTEADIPLAALQPSLVFFRAPAGSSVRVTLGGDGWKAVQLDLDVARAAVTTAPLLTARALSNLTVNWWTTTDLAAVLQRHSGCDTGESVEPAPVVATLLTDTSPRADVPRPASVDSPTADPHVELELARDRRDGTVHFESLADGSYTFRVTHPGLPPFEKQVDVLGDTAVDVHIDYVMISGTVRKSNRPVRARVLGTVSDLNTGRYEALLAEVPSATSLIHVEPCDGSPPYWFVPPTSLADHSVLDIEIPANQVAVRVTDAAAGTPLNAAQVTYRARQGDALLDLGGGTTGADGQYVIAPVTPTQALTVCAAAEQFQSVCAEPFPVDASTDRTVELRLPGATARRGRVALAGDKTGRVIWCSADGRITESVVVQPDGTFSFLRSHDESEVVTYAGRTHPLIALRHPPTAADAVFEIRLPNPMRLRTLTVGLSAGSKEEAAFATIVIGDVVVPASAMDSYLAMRGARRSMRPGMSITIPDIAEWAPLTVVLMPFSLLQQTRYDDRDAALLPDIAPAFPRKRVGQEQTVQFP